MHLVGGPMQVVYLLKGLHERGHDALLVCPKGSGIGNHAESLGLKVCAVPVRGDLDLAFIPKLTGIIREYKPQVVHLHSRRGADTLGGIAARMAGAPVVVLSRRVTDPIGHLGKLKFGPLCDRIIAVSNAIARTLVEGGVDPGKIVTVHSVIDPKLYQVKGDSDRLRDELGIKPGEKVISVIAQLIKIKGHRYLFEAAPAILEAAPNTVLLILGEGDLKDELSALAEKIGIADRAIFAGFRRDVSELLAMTTTLVHPSTMEGLANAVLQAMAAEVPVVVAAVGGMPEAVRDGFNGLLVPPADSTAIAKAAIRLLSDPQLCAKLGSAARNTVEQEFSVDGMVEGVLKVYREALGEKE
jgi:glycosyltransferase involved in cell wall biosynthesis